jgi:hypothetical protein
MNHQPAPIADAHPMLQRIIRRALKKEPAERYQTADELFGDLRRLALEMNPESNRKGARRLALAVSAMATVSVLAVVLLFA